MTSRDLTDEKGQFIKSVYDEMFKLYPELLPTEEYSCWLTRCTDPVWCPIINLYDDKIKEKYGESCLIEVTLPYNKTVVNYDYDTWCYISTVLEPYGYTLL